MFYKLYKWFQIAQNVTDVGVLMYQISKMFLRELRQISLLTLNEFKRINEVLLSMISGGKEVI